ncbi:MAG: hypothetical protein ACI8PZ_006311 [Myxococcota bacterium]|jgi:hypothetical protein
MDKNGKLQRYDRKDYTELVDFPVEIVGRDGVVRRYPFEDSVRLYQRRITFAPIRYRDQELVGAEADHCRSRIEQLRRSYFVQFGWGTPEGQQDGEALFGELAGELAAFIRRVLRCDQRPEVRFERLDGEGALSTWRMSTPRRDQMVLYVYGFTPGDDEARGRFFSLLKQLERTGRTGDDGERLLAFHHMVDCGIVLTGNGAALPALDPGDDGQMVDLAPTPWDDALEAIRQGEYEDGLRRCQSIVKDQPWHHRAYVAGSLAAAYLGDVHVAEELGLLGLCFFKDDPALLRNVGVARLRDGRGAQAMAPLRRAVEIAPDDGAARASLIAALQRQVRYSEMRAVLAARRTSPPDDRRVADELDRLDTWLGRQRALRWLGWTLGLGGLLGVAAAGLGAVAVGGAGGLVLLVLRLAERRVVDSMLARLRHEEVTSGLRRLSRRSSAVRVT